MFYLIQDDEDGNYLNNLVDNLPSELRQRIISGQNIDDDDEEEDEDGTQGESWGKKKAYWDGDTADLEIGQDIADAEEEEDAALVYTHSHIYLIRIYLPPLLT